MRTWLLTCSFWPYEAFVGLVSRVLDEWSRERRRGWTEYQQADTHKYKDGYFCEMGSGGASAMKRTDNNMVHSGRYFFYENGAVTFWFLAPKCSLRVINNTAPSPSLRKPSHFYKTTSSGQLLTAIASSTWSSAYMIFCASCIWQRSCAWNTCEVSLSPAHQDPSKALITIKRWRTTPVPCTADVHQKEHVNKKRRICFLW